MSGIKQKSMLILFQILIWIMSDLVWGQELVTRRYMVFSLDPFDMIERIKPLLSPIGQVKYHDETQSIEVRDTPEVQYKVITLLSMIGSQRRQKLQPVRLRVALIDSEKLLKAGGQIRWDQPPTDPPVGLLFAPEEKKAKKKGATQIKWRLYEEELFLLNGKPGVIFFPTPNGGRIHLKVTPQIQPQEIIVQIEPVQIPSDLNLLSGPLSDQILRSPLNQLNVGVIVQQGEEIVLGSNGSKEGLLLHIVVEIVHPKLR